jgi:hypothetical protein
MWFISSEAMLTRSFSTEELAPLFSGCSGEKYQRKSYEPLFRRKIKYSWKLSNVSLSKSLPDHNPKSHTRDSDARLLLGF